MELGKSKKLVPQALSLFATCTVGSVLSFVVVFGLFLYAGDDSFTARLVRSDEIKTVYFCLLMIPFAGFFISFTAASARDDFKLFDVFPASMSVLATGMIFGLSACVGFIHKSLESLDLTILAVFGSLYVTYSLSGALGRNFQRRFITKDDGFEY